MSLRRTAPSYKHWIALALAHALRADALAPGGRRRNALLARARNCLGRLPGWLPPLVDRLARMPLPVWRKHTVPTLAEHLLDLPEFGAAFDAARYLLPRVRRLLLRPAAMGMRPLAFDAIALPDLPTARALADWLGIDLARLEWFAGRQQHFREAQASDDHRPPRPSATRHYRCLLRAKRNGGLRLIEAPKPDLQRVQRRLLDGLLSRLPPHEAAHGFVKGRDVRTHAAVHAGQACVLAFDMRDFFCSIGYARIHALWRTLGHPEGVADLLATLCTTRTPAAVRERLHGEGAIDFLGAKRLASPHLPQGAPTSPALANLCAFRLDLRLESLAHRFGARYSRYADDLVFSGPASLSHRHRSLHAWVDAIVRSEGFALHPAKTRRMTAGMQQRITGVVVNERPNLPRRDYDLLRAELHRLAQAPSVDASLRAHLLGRLAWALRFVVPSRAAKLRRLFDRIRFESSNGN
jgi:RNA-directed DNA polymerase